jgi:hypothetical protein
MSVFSSVGDRVPDHLRGPRGRKSVSRINTSTSADASLRIKIVVRQVIILTLRVTHRYSTCDPGPSDCAKRQGANLTSRFTACSVRLTPVPMRPGLGLAIVVGTRSKHRACSLSLLDSCPADLKGLQLQQGQPLRQAAASTSRDPCIGTMMGRLEPAIWSASGVGLVVEAAVREGTAKALMKEEEQESRRPLS